MVFKVRISTNNISDAFQEDTPNIGVNTVKDLRKMLKTPFLSPNVIDGFVHIRRNDLFTELTFKQACKCACLKESNSVTTYLTSKGKFSISYIDRVIEVTRSEVTDGITNIKLSYKLNVDKLVQEFIFQGGLLHTALQTAKDDDCFCNTIIKEEGVDID